MGIIYKSPPFSSDYKVKVDSMYTTENTLSSRWEHSFTTITSSTVPLSSIVLSPATMPYREGGLYYDQTEGSMVFYNNQSDLGLNIGQEHWMKGINKSGVDIHNGDVVRVDGAQGDQPRFKKALAISSESPFCIMGLATQDIPNNEIGYITVRGIVRGIDTRAYPAGTRLWASHTTAGAYVTVAPHPPGVSVRVGVVVRSANDGQIYVAVLYVPNLSDLSDVDGAPISANGQMPVWRPSISAFDFDCNINDYLLLSTFRTASSDFITSSLTNISATNGLIIGPNNNATFYLKDSATVWNDLVIPITQTRVGGSAPSFLRWGTGGLYVYKFNPGDEVFTSAQMPHTWKSGTMIYPHIHWCQDNDTASPAVGLSAVRWNIEITWTGYPGGDFLPNNTATYWATADVVGPNKQIMTNIPLSGISPNSFAPFASGVSSLMMIRVYRGGEGDTYGATRVNGLSFDIHHEIDSLGSENITQKYI